MHRVLRTGDELESWAARAAGADATIVDLLREQAARTPAAVAVQFESDVLTYAELDARANRLGSHLRARGIGPEVLAGVFVERSVDMVVAVLGVHRAGGAFVPIDPGYPPERIAFILADAAAKVVVTQERLRDLLPPELTIVSLDGDLAAIAAADPALPAPGATPTQLAYVIYTSGSTGKPKGAQIEDRNVVNFVSAMQAALKLAPGDTVLATAALAFDISGLDIYLSLACGARVVLASRETAMNPKALIALMERERPTVMQGTPSLWRMLVASGWQGASGLTVVCGGEAVSQPLAEQLLERADAVWNAYGPTEATIYATLQRLAPKEPVTIGRPIANVNAHVLDANAHPVAAGITGELYVGGAGVGRGYLNRPQLTAQRFVADHLRDAPGARLYRTGDLARIRPDGVIEFLGRADFQVKLRGYRIEPGEIEAALEQRQEIASALVVVREDASGDQRLVAYVIGAANVSLATRRLRRDLERELPRYMIPDAIVVLDAFPLNTSGKVDRARLPAPAFDSLDRRGVAVEPRTALEAQLVGIWEEVLSSRPIGVTDDFFELGASSIVAARLFDRIERKLGTRLPLAPLFQAPTIEKLAELVQTKAAQRRFTSLVAIQPLGRKPPVFCVHGGAGTILHLQALAARLGTDQPFYGLQMQGLYGDACPHLTAEQMAAHYLGEIAAIQPSGPYAIAGYCFGALVAFEMACQLERRGEEVALLATLNGASTTYIRTFGAYGSPVAASVAGPHPRWSWLRRRLPFTNHLRPRLWFSRQRKRAYRLRRRALGKLAGVAARLWVACRRPLPDAWREPAIFEICHVIERRYRPGRFSGSMLVIAGAGLFQRPDLGWGPFVTGGVQVCEVEQAVNHNTMRTMLLEPYVAAVAHRLESELTQAFSVGRARC